MKTKEELKTLKEKVETLNKKLAELTEEELVQVTGGDSHSNAPAIFPNPMILMTRNPNYPSIASPMLYHNPVSEFERRISP